MMEWMVKNWYLIVALISLVCVAVYFTIKFMKEPSEEKIETVKRFLEWAVVEAEKELGTGTGQLKLRKVYSMAVQAFPWIPALVSFETFSEWVDEALAWMEKQLFVNSNMKAIIEGNNNGK